MTQIAMSAVQVDFGATTVLRDVTFTVAAGEKWGVIGRNGSGKTTLFRLLTREIEPTAGSIARAPGLRISLLEQHRDFGGAKTVWDAVAGSFAELRDLEESLALQAHELGSHTGDASTAALDRYSRDLERFERQGGYTIASRVDAVLDGLGFDPVKARTRALDELSGGERGRVGLARQLVAPADCLLLDEPTNHLDLETTRWLEDYLADAPATLMLVSHDRAFLAAVVDHVLHLEQESASPYVGDYASFVTQRTERQLTQRRAFDRQQRFVADEADYIRRNIAGQNTKQAKGRRKRLDRLPRLSPPRTDSSTMAVQFASSTRGGDQVLVAEHVALAVEGGERVLVRDFTSTIRRGDRVGLVGPNGAGKTTLLRAIVGDTQPADGELRTGGSTALAYYRQDLTQLPARRTIYDVINELRPLWERGQVQGHLGRFGFSGDEVQRRTDVLSGGEQARVALAMMVLARANFLVLDEPTNHLDVESIETLEDALLEYDGSLLLVSHDRALLRTLTTRVWELRDGMIHVFDGPFAEWEVMDEARREAVDARVADDGAVRKERARNKQEQRQVSERGQRDAVRRARREAEAAEAEVVALDVRVTDLTARLANPSTYQAPNGSQDAVRLGTELEATRRALDAALYQWTELAERAERLRTDG